MGPVGRWRRRWLSLGADVRMLVFITVGALAGDVLAWGEGVRNGQSPAVNIVFTVFLIGFFSYAWWRMYHELRGPGSTKSNRPVSTDPDVGPAKPSDGLRP